MAVSNLVAPQAGKTLKVATFTNPGLSTFTLPSGYDGSNPLVADVTIVGGGGASGSGEFNSFSAGTYHSIPGAGGGGAVWKGTVALTQNMNVHVGRGGFTNRAVIGGRYNWHGGNGGTSYISTGTPKNWFINPQFLGGANDGSANTNLAPFTNTVFLRDDQPRFSGAVLRYSSTYYGGYTSSSAIPVLPSTNYCWSMYAWESNGSTCTLGLYWYTSEGVAISNVTNAGQSISTNGGVNAGQIYVGGTSPANAAYVVLSFYTGFGSRNFYFSNSRLESGSTTPTTYTDGGTSGHFYAGPSAGALTFANSDTTYYAAGGGGGTGFRGTLNSIIHNGTASPFHGYAGGCSGGGGFLTDAIALSSTYYAVGGHGGGAGGNAEAPQFASGITNWGGTSSNTPGLNYNSTQGAGSRAVGVYDSGGNWYVSQSRNGAPGVGLDGYGKGGAGRSALGGPWAGISRTPFSFNDNPADASSVVVEAGRILGGKPNTGDGADSAMFYASSNYYADGYTGGSGLVIIKYWE